MWTRNPNTMTPTSELEKKIEELEKRHQEDLERINEMASKIAEYTRGPHPDELQRRIFELTNELKEERRRAKEERQRDLEDRLTDQAIIEGLRAKIEELEQQLSQIPLIPMQQDKSGISRSRQKENFGMVDADFAMDSSVEERMEEDENSDEEEEEKEEEDDEEDEEEENEDEEEEEDDAKEEKEDEEEEKEEEEKEDEQEEDDDEKSDEEEEERDEEEDEEDYEEEGEEYHEKSDGEGEPSVKKSRLEDSENIETNTDKRLNDFMETDNELVDNDGEEEYSRDSIDMPQSSSLVNVESTKRIRHVHENKTYLECPECEYRTQSASGWMHHLRDKHSTTPSLAGLALLCECGHESLSHHHSVKCNESCTVIRKRDGPIERLKKKETPQTPQCELCDMHPSTINSYMQHLRRHHRSTLVKSGIFLKCSCGFIARSEATSTIDHTKECDDRMFTVHNLEEMEKTTPQCAYSTCDASPSTILGYITHLRRHHNSSLNENGIYLKCDCGFTARSKNKYVVNHIKECDCKRFSLHKIDED